MKQVQRLSRSVAVLKCCFALTLFFAACCASYAQKTNLSGAQKPTVLVLAASHMNNRGRDVFNVKWDDVLTAKRQQEIRQFVDLLKRFKPTKIAIEAPLGSINYEERYRRYLRGEYELSRDETDQIGFRLAKQLNHQKIYNVNAEGTFDVERVLAFAAANNQQEIIDRTSEVFKRHTAELNKLIQTATVKEIYKVLNNQQRIDEEHEAYLMMARIGKDKEYPGVEVLADWYKRNLKIFSNITRITESKDDRILVVFGAGHAKLLQQFIEDSGEYNLERAGKYL
jgi:hypothetical protein